MDSERSQAWVGGNGVVLCGGCDVDRGRRGALRSSQSGKGSEGAGMREQRATSNVEEMGQGARAKTPDYVPVIVPVPPNSSNDSSIQQKANRQGIVTD
jgi:hypothetical protein